jgi:hypothetical protein
MTTQEIDTEKTDDVELCRELLRVASSLDKGQTACIYFLTAAKRRSVMETMTRRYADADVRRIEFGLYH